MRYGIDIGGSKIELVVFNPQMINLWQRRVATPTDDYCAFLNTIKQLVHEADQRFTTLGRVGIGVAGVIDPQTQRQLASNIPCLKGQRLQQDLEQQLGRCVNIANDSHCFTLSEACSGAAQAYRSVFGVILGTGAGGGWVIDQKLHLGKQGVAGEWGHLPIPARLVIDYQLPVKVCSCGLRGCYEHYVSGSGLLALSQHFAHRAVDTHSLMQSYRQQDPLAIKIFDCFIEILAAALGGLQTVLDVDAFVLGGGLSNIDEIYRKLPVAMSGWLLPFSRPAPLLAPTGGDSSGVRGAALLADSYHRKSE